MAIAACGSTAPETAPTSTTRAATATAAFCGVYPAFAEKLNMALANANPDVRQYTVIEPILTDLAPVLQQLRDAEPPALKGTAETWVAEMHKYATGNYPVTAAEEARSRMADWASSNC
ncbi:MAG TPA: hypothetical protein VFP54_10895 [Acidimicrobiales bacterium]|nr:hypothetical protein [Acidimicrobiales bacterium]